MNSKSMKKAIIFAVAAFAAATAGARTLSQAEAIDTIISNNSRLKALRANAEADYQSDLYEAKRLNDPEVEFEHLWGPDDNKKWNIGVSQSFDWPGAYGKRIRTAESRRQAWTYRYAAEELSLRTSAKEAFAMGVYARRRLDLLQRVYENMDSLRNYITTGYRDGQLTILDVKKIQLELYGLRARIADVSQESMQAGAELAALNDGNALDADFGAYPAEPMYDLSRYLEYASSANPDVTAAEATAKSARLEADAVAASRMPGFTVGYRHAFEEDGYLTHDILWREKAAFSDAVGHSMVDYLKEYAESCYTQEEFELKRQKYSHAQPFTKESLLYREIFEKYYPGQGQMIVDFWMPNKEWEGCNVSDPSARVLSNYGDSGK